MYRVTITVVDNPVIFDTDNRKAARGLYELALEQKDKLEVSVEVMATPKPVKFKGLPVQNES